MPAALQVMAPVIIVVFALLIWGVIEQVWPPD